MKKYKKTYAIHTLAEKHTTFHLGKTRVHVSFTGGQTTKNGVNPATFTTTDPIVQLAIERSNDFAKGAISLLAKYPMQGEVKIGRNVKVEADLPAEEGAPLPPEGGDLEREDATSEDEAGIPADEMCAPLPPEGGGLERRPDAEGIPEVVEVSCKDVAKQYLEDHYGERPAPLRTWSDVQECASKYGIIFKSPTLE